LLLRLKLLVGQSGGSPGCALMRGRISDVAGKKVGVVLSGGNVDSEKHVGDSGLLAPKFFQCKI